MEERAIYVDIDPNDIHDAEPELLFDSHYRAKQIMLDYGADPLIKAGSPISASGKVSNNASAIGILKRDCYRHLTSVGDVIIGGYIKSDIAQRHSGIEISDAARAAMSRLAFIGADGIPQPAAGGGVFTATFSLDFESHKWTADKTYDEILAAMRSEKPVIGLCAGMQVTIRPASNNKRIDLVSAQDITTVINNDTSPATITVGVSYGYVLLDRDGFFQAFSFVQEVSGESM